MQHLAADRVVDLRLEVVLGDHQVGGAAADVDAGDADFVGLVAEGSACGRRPRPGLAGPRHARAGRGGGRPARPRRLGGRLFRLRLLPAAVLVQAWRTTAAGPGPASAARSRCSVRWTALASSMLRFSSGLTRWFLPSVMAKMLIALLRLGLEALLLLLDHAAGIAEREGADFAGPARVARGVR